MELYNAAIIFVLAFLGLVVIVGLIFSIWLVHEFDIAFEFRSRKELTQELASHDLAAEPEGNPQAGETDPEPGPG